MPGPPAPGPSISVVVTCHNYGHFLEDCLASLRAQTRPADQIIVVDDGSTDDSRSVLGRQPPGLTILAQPNRGQAAAFNAGFARTTGDLVLFLDADDMLLSDALETLAAAWHPSLAALGFGLALIDGAGQPSGAYPVEPVEGDMRPELIARGHFRFMPTSGNIFTRQSIAPGFPLPEARWRISADAVLLRLAALAGPIRGLPFVLGSYRAHGGNSYHRSAAPEMRFLRRAIEDMADASLAAADAPDVLIGPEADLIRLQLILAHLRLRLGLGGADRSTLGTARVRIRALAIPARARLSLGIGLRLAAPALHLAPATRGWLLAQDGRPRWLQALLAWALGRALDDRRRALHRPRWAPPALPGAVAIGQAAAFCNAYDWRDPGATGRRRLCHPWGEILVALPAMAHGCRIGFDLKATDRLADTPLAVTLAKGDEVLALCTLLGEDRIALVLEPSETLGEAPIRLRLSARLAGHGWLRAWLAPSALLEMSGLVVEPLGPPEPRLLLGLGEVRRFADIAAATQIEPAFDPGAPPGPIETPRLVLGLVRPALPQPATLVMRFGPAQAPGTLTAGAEGIVPQRARIGPGAEMRVPLAPRRDREDRPLDLTLDLEPLDPLDAPGFDLASLGLAGADDPLSPGTIRTFGPDPDPLLGEGWIPGPTGALLYESLGTLRLAFAPSTPDDARLHLRLAPVEPLPPDAALALVVSAETGPLAQIRLRGDYELAVPLGPALAGGRRRIELGLLVVLMIEGDGEPTRRPGALCLRALRLDAAGSAIAARPALPPDPPRSLAAAIRDAAGLAETHAPPAALREARDRIRDRLATLAPGAVRSELLNTATLGRLLALARACHAAGLAAAPPAETAAVTAALCGPDAAEAARALALAILTVPPWTALGPRPPQALHEGLRANPWALAHYLCETGPAPGAADLAACRAHTLALWTFARDAFLAEPRGSRNDRLAEEILGQLHPHPLLFGPGSLRDLARARGRATEAYLLSRGHRITLPPPPDPAPRPRLRLGVLLRHLGPVPETWILKGTVGQLDPARFETHLFLAEACDAPEPPPAGARLVPLDGLDLAASVETIRAAELDLLLLGGFFLGHDRLAAIAAHRLAPVQLATTAVAPMTTGLASVDAMLTSRASEPPDAAAQYSERLCLADGPVQRFDFGAPPPEMPDRRLARARLGLPPDGVVLISGAALGKIGDDLLETWLALLAAVPEAVLVLYPFARNWRRPQIRAGFEARLAAAAAPRGVGRDRVLLLDSLDHAAVERLLALGDLYLDSFPYAGATTLVEALRARLPAVALAGDSQRGLQGAAWLREAGLGDLVATTPDAYAATAARLARSPADRAAARAAIRLPPVPDPDFTRSFGARLVALSGVPLQAAPRHLFHHMPKAGGTSTRRIFADWFAIRDDDRPPWSLAPAPPPPDLATLGPETLICGHFNSPGYFLRERYRGLLGAPDWRLITFLRDPLETALSYHAFEARHRPKAEPDFRPLDLDTYLATCPPPLAEHLASVSDDWRRALDAYWFIGTLDRFEDGLRWLALHFGRVLPATIPRLNPGPRPPRPSQAAIDTFLSNNAEDFVIYRAAAARSAAILETNPRPA